MRFTPGWSVAYYFIPILNLFRPYQVMREIWHVSGNPEKHKDQDEGSPLLSWWWGLWLVSGFIGMALGNAVDASQVVHIDDLRRETWLSIVASLLAIPLCLVAIRLVKTIFARQERLVRGGAAQ